MHFVSRIGRMKVLHVIPSVAAADGGPAQAVVQMVKMLRSHGTDAQIVTTDDAGHGQRMNVEHAKVVEHSECPIYFFPRQIRFYKMSFPLGKWLTEHVRDYDVVHIHALFSFASWAAGRACRESGIPYIVRPLGLLNRYGMEQRRPWLKKLSFRFIERRLLNGASAIHYTSQQEANEAAVLQLKAPAEIIPLGIDLQPFAQLPDAGLFHARWNKTMGRRLVLFLSRIDAKKGLDVLLPAFAQVKLNQPHAMLVIAGNGDAALEATLRQQALELGIHDDVLWTGFLGGEGKFSALAAAEVFTLPSRSENFGIALLEAMAAGCACVTTPGVALAHDAAPGSLSVVPLEVSSLAHAITELLDQRDAAIRLGEAARRCVLNKFSSEAATGLLLALYAKVIQRHNLP